METTDKKIVVDFLELDDIRLTIARICKKNQWRKRFPHTLRTGSKAPYHSSTFYVGRGVTQFTFKGLRCNFAEIETLAKVLRERYPYSVMIDHFDRKLTIYVRRE